MLWIFTSQDGIPVGPQHGLALVEELHAFEDSLKSTYQFSRSADHASPFDKLMQVRGQRSWYEVMR